MGTDQLGPVAHRSIAILTGRLRRARVREDLTSKIKTLRDHLAQSLIH